MCVCHNRRDSVADGGTVRNVQVRSLLKAGVTITPWPISTRNANNEAIITLTTTTTAYTE